MLVLPVLLALFALVAEGGRVLWHHQLISKGVRDATRYLSRVDDPTRRHRAALASNLALCGQLAGTATHGWRVGPMAPRQCRRSPPIDNSGGISSGPPRSRWSTVTATVPLDYPFAAVLRFFDPTIPTCSPSPPPTARGTTASEAAMLDASGGMIAARRWSSSP